MGDRYRAWLGAGFLAGGFTAAVLAGAGVAAADDGQSNGSGAGASTDSGGSDVSGRDNESTSKLGKSASSTTSTTTGTPDTDRQSDDSRGERGTPSNVDDDPDEAEGADGLDDLSGTDDADDPGGDPGDGGDGSESSQASETLPSVDRGPEEANQDGDLVTEPSDPVLSEVVSGGDFTEPQETEDAPAEEIAEEVSELAEPALNSASEALAEPDIAADVTAFEADLPAREAAAVMRTTAAEVAWLRATPPDLLAVLNDVGSFLYNAYTRAMTLLAGPVRAPFGSTVRVESSTLLLGDAVEVPADWYFPDTDEPAGLIYLQHGFLATAAFYSATAAYLAEKTSSIVVAPTLTWNIFDTGNYPLMLPETYRAVADLFIGDRSALNASARAAGYGAALPDRVVLVGHSSGGGLVVGAAGHLAELGAIDDLAGVVMLDGVAYPDQFVSDLTKIPASVPVYDLAGEPYSWNDHGDALRRLAEARPGVFAGGVIKGGRHADTMQSSSPMVQLVSYLGTGFSLPWNVTASRVTASGWVNDMFNGTRTEQFYGAPGSSLSPFAGWGWSSIAGADVLPIDHEYVGRLDMFLSCLLNPASSACSATVMPTPFWLAVSDIRVA